jgi:ABC-2 type transport system ATP-binding protein
MKMETFDNVSISIHEVTKEYNKEKGIFNVSTTFLPGRLNLVVGKNGSGKSTLFKCIMGLCRYQGDIKRRRLRIGYAPEDYIMPLHMTVIDFLYSIGRIKGEPKEELNEHVKYYLEYFNLSESEYKPISQLSHGMRQKVNLMQTFIYDPKILILDEPLAALDKQSIPKVVQLIQRKAKQCLVLVSTHNPQHFKVRNKRIYQFENGTLYCD